MYAVKESTPVSPNHWLLSFVRALQTTVRCPIRGTGLDSPSILQIPLSIPIEIYAGREIVHLVQLYRQRIYCHWDLKVKWELVGSVSAYEC
jgi:hypothetical protein